jgi:hypothetical protein
VCYSVAISTVLQAYLTTFLIEPGYEEPIRTVEQMLKSEMKFGFYEQYAAYYNITPNFVDSAILSKSLQCPEVGPFFNWAAFYQNMSFVSENLNMEICRDIGNLRDQNNRHLLCELEDGGVTSGEKVLLVYRGNPLLEMINEIIDRMVESGIVSHIKKRDFAKEKILCMPHVFEFEDTYTAFGVMQLQTAFYILILGNVLAVAGFVTEIMWHRYRSKKCETKFPSLCHSRNA